MGPSAQAPGAGAAGLDLKEMKLQQLRREVQCAVGLARRLQPYVDGDEETFSAFVVAEVAAMSKATFGEPLMHAIGAAYEAAADRWEHALTGSTAPVPPYSMCFMTRTM